MQRAFRIGAAIAGFVGCIAFVACSGLTSGPSGLGSGTQSCTEVGCQDMASVMLRTADNTWPEGLYELIVRADDIESRCSLRLPDQTPQTGQSTNVICGTSGVAFALQQDTTCESGCDGGVCWNRCTPVAGSFYQRVSVQGAPARLQITLSRDSAALVTTDLAPTYQETRPNGPNCEPVCRQASIDLAVP
jgi:hypothetical protein